MTYYEVFVEAEFDGDMILKATADTAIEAIDIVATKYPNRPFEIVEVNR